MLLSWERSSLTNDALFFYRDLVMIGPFCQFFQGHFFFFWRKFTIEGAYFSTAQPSLFANEESQCVGLFWWNLSVNSNQLPADDCRQKGWMNASEDTLPGRWNRWTPPFLPGYKLDIDPNLWTYIVLKFFFSYSSQILKPMILYVKQMNKLMQKMYIICSLTPTQLLNL